MPEPAFIVCGDAHLDSLIWKARHKITGDAEAAFKAVVDLAIELHLPLVLAGDVFDHVNPSTPIILFFRQQMDRCQEECVDVYFIQGNHDKRREDVPLVSALHHHPKWLDMYASPDLPGGPVSIGGVCCQGLDYDTRERIQEKIGSMHNRRRPDVLVMHQAVKQHLRFEDAWNADLEWVPEDVKLIVLGDLHAQLQSSVREGQEAAYTCSTHPRNLRELESHHCLVVNEDLTWYREELPVRSMREFRLTANDQIAEVERWLRECPRGHFPPVAWLKHTPDVQSECMRLEAEQDTAIIVREGYTAVSEMEIEDVLEEAVDADSLINIEQLLGTLIDPETDEEAFSFVLELIREGESVLDVIRRRRQEALAEEH